MNMAILNPRVILTLIVCLSTGIWSMRTPYFSYEKYFSLSGFAHYLVFYTLIWICAWMVEKSSLNPLQTKPTEQQFRTMNGDGRLIRKEAVVLGVIAFAAQWIWIAKMIMNEGIGPLIQMVVIEQDFQTFKLDVVNKSMIAGVTSCTQLGMLAAALYSVYVFGMKRSGSVWIWLMIVFPGALRGMFFSERLALMEIIIPIVAVALIFNKVKLTLPRLLLFAIAFVIFFSLAEGMRSYSYYSSNGFEQDGVYAYGLERFLDYITSSVNHSIAMVDLSNQSAAFPSLMFNGWLNLTKMFVPGEAVNTFLHTGQAADAYWNVKNSVYSAPDYTNMGYFGHIFADSGYLYILYAIVYGAIIGLAFKGVKHYQLGWLAAYPIIIISLLESYRIPYLFETRAFYPLLYIAIRYIAISAYERKRGVRDGAG